MAEADWQSRDPHYEQERLKYPQPAPSREYLRMLLTEAGEPLGREAIIERGGITGAEALEGVERRLAPWSGTASWPSTARAPMD